MIEKILDRARAEMFDLKLHKSSFHKGFNDGVYTVMKIVREEAKDGGWIPCSERLPEEDYTTVWAVELDEDGIGYYYSAVWTKEHGFRTSDLDAEGTPDAWMPLVLYQKGE